MFKKPYSDPIIKKYRKKRNKLKKKHRVLKITVTVFSALFITAAIVILNLSSILNIFGQDSSFENQFIESKKFNKIDVKSNILGDFDFESMTGKSNLNILIFGIDRDEARKEQYDYFRPDTIMVASINLEDHSISLLSIPRDSRVSIHGRSGMDKINACFYYGALGKSDEDEYQGGIDCLKGTVEDLLGVKMNYYVGIDMSGVVKIVNTIGGVEVDVHTNVYVKGVRKIKKGTQVLNGTNFLRYARYRDYTDGDIGRTKVQQELIKTLFKSILDSKNLINIATLASQVNEMIDTNFNFNELLALALKATEFDMSKFKTATLPGSFLNLNNTSYWKVSMSEARSAFKKLTK